MPPKQPSDTAPGEVSHALQRRLACAARLVADLFGEPVVQLLPAAKGANSAIYRAQTQRFGCAVKLYGSHGVGGGERLAREWQALTLLEEHQVGGVPRPLARDDASTLALLSWAEGRLLARDEIQPHHVRDLVGFLVRVQSLRSTPEAAEVGKAAEACFSMSEHVGLVKARVQRLLGALEEGSARKEAVVREALAWVEACLAPALEALVAPMEQATQTAQLGWEEFVPHNLRVLSPSDIGFHNVLVDEYGRSTCIDWEYFGWDDPGKTICDLLLHPDKGLPPSSLATVLEVLKTQTDWGRTGVRRARVLLPLLGIKWCTIMLNPLLRVYPTESSQGDRHPGGLASGFLNPEVAERLQTRLSATQRYFEGLPQRLQELPWEAAYP